MIGVSSIVGAGLLLGGGALARPRLRLRANTGAIESAPVLLAARDHFPGGIDVAKGGIPNLVGAVNIAGVFDDRGRVLRMWRAKGLTTFAVGDTDNYNF